MKIPYFIIALISIALYLIEMFMGYQHSLESPAFFIWAERLCAAILTYEIFYRAKKGEYGEKIFGRPMMVIDVISILPFFVGFFVPVAHLGWIRSLRILRVLKALRYSRSLRLVYLSFYKARNQLKPLITAWVMIALFSAMVMFQAERNAQEDFDSVLNAVYFSFVTATTIGYGDMSPVTPVGRTVIIATMSLNLALFAGLIGIVGSSISAVMKDEEDKTIDPLTIDQLENHEIY